MPHDVTTMTFQTKYGFDFRQYHLLWNNKFDSIACLHELVLFGHFEYGQRWFGTN